MDEELADLAGTRNARRLLELSEKQMFELLAALDLYAESILDGEDLKVVDVANARIALAKARSQLLDEVIKHENCVALERGLVAAAPLDFDKIRDEIGSKLDRLRDTRRAEGVS